MTLDLDALRGHTPFVVGRTLKDGQLCILMDGDSVVCTFGDRQLGTTERADVAELFVTAANAYLDAASKRKHNADGRIAFGIVSLPAQEVVSFMRGRARALHARQRIFSAPVMQDGGKPGMDDADAANGLLAGADAIEELLAYRARDAAVAELVAAAESYWSVTDDPDERNEVRRSARRLHQAILAIQGAANER